MTRAPHPSSSVTAMLCPACAPRYAGLIDPGCPCCAGLGALVIAPAALEREQPGVIARAVQMYLREFLGPFWRSKPGAPEAVRIAVRALVEVDFLIETPASDAEPVTEPYNRQEIGRAAAKLARQLGADDGCDIPPNDFPANVTPDAIEQDPTRPFVADELAARRSRKAR